MDFQRQDTPIQGSRNSEIELLIRKAQLPTLPLVAKKLIDLCKDENATFSDFAQVIASDQGQASRILRVANSAFYGLRHKVSNLERAIKVLGLKYVKSVSLGFHLACELSKLGGTGLNVDEFWRQSLLRGCIARQLAYQYCPGVGEEAFLVGLLQDCGILVLNRVLGKDYANLWNNTKYSQPALYRMERELFHYDHLKVAGALARVWFLPEILARPIRTHHGKGVTEPSTEEMIQLCQMSYFTGTLSLNNPASFGQQDLDLPQYCHNVFGLDIKSLDKIFQESREQYSNIAKLFAGIIPEQLDVQDLLTQAKELLSSLSAGTSQELFDLAKEVEYFQQQCQRLIIEVDDSLKQASKDELTDFLMEDALEVYLDSACKEDNNRTNSLLVMHISIGEIEEEGGGREQADSFLENFAGLLKKLFDGSGCLCRYRKGALAVALMGLRRHQAIQLAEGLMKKINEMNIPVVEEEVSSSDDIDCTIHAMYFPAGEQPENGRQAIDILDNCISDLETKDKKGLHFQISSG